MELRHLRYFIRAAELLNFTRAAESLYVSQPTLSVQIHQLEQELGSELFARAGRNVRLTESGRVFLVRALQAVKELEEGGKEVDAIKGLLRGNLCVSSLPLYGSRLVYEWLAEFNSQHPNVFIKVRSGASEDIEAAVLTGAVDLGISILPEQHSPELNVRTLFRDEIVIVASTQHPLAKAKSWEFADLEKTPMVLPSERISATQMLGKYFEDRKIQPNICMSFDNGHAMLALVKKGKFITFLPKWTVKGDPELCLLALPPPGVSISTGAIWSSLSAAAQVLLELITEESKKLEDG